VSRAAKKALKTRDRASSRWDEIYDAEGQPRAAYRRLLDHFERFSDPEIRALGERMEATLREMGVTFSPGKNAQPWVCDLLPHIFSRDEWDLIVRGTRQRLKAFELLLQDVYGPREILRAGVIPIHAVLASPHYQSPAIGLPRAQGAYLHLSGICLARDSQGRLMVKDHHFSRSSGISYMMQNRRALARVVPKIFQDSTLRPLAGIPLAIMEELRYAANGSGSDVAVVLLTPGPGNPVYSAHSFLARRMGVPLVQGGDLLVLDDRVYLKTIHGLKRVDVICNRVGDSWLDPLVFRRDSLLGVPGLVHCLRRGTVKIINAIGSQLADDRSLLCFAQKIIRFYLGESPVLPTVPTYWLGDIDQREMVLENLEAYQVRPLFGSDVAAVEQPSAQLLPEIRKEASRFVAQAVNGSSMVAHMQRGRRLELQQDHILFALRDGASYEVFPGALTRVFFAPKHRPDASWVTRDTWVSSDTAERPLFHARQRQGTDAEVPLREVTSRVADAFYWLGRYLERAHHQAYLIQVVETLESEELNSAERKLYRPMWNLLLPPLEKSLGISRRSMTTRLDRYKLSMAPETGSVLSTFLRAYSNAESIQEVLSPEAWLPLSSLRAVFERAKFKSDIGEEEFVRVTRRTCDSVTRFIPQFFATARSTMLADDGWRFCEMGEMIERAVITANSVHSISSALSREVAQATEIELSAFLRLLGTRDAYRRVFQRRAEPIPVLELLWQHTQAPRSVLRCLESCLHLLKQSAAGADSRGAKKAIAGVEELIQRIKRIDWSQYLHPAADEESAEVQHVAGGGKTHALEPLLGSLISETLEIHQLISDSFLSHQTYIAQTVQPPLQGL
jgi:uncharacterized circularly permuted ATP-grasp superfamily protein/uncharacterized alpha-E superfamily protein